MSYIPKERRDELCDEVYEMGDTRIVGDMGERVTFCELRALLDMADQRDELLEAIDAIFEDGTWVGGEFIPSDSAKAKAEAALIMARGYA